MINEIQCSNCGGSGCDSLNEQYEPCAVCNGTGREIVQSDYEIGTVIQYRDDETDELMIATVRVIAWEEYLNNEKEAA